MKIPRPEELNPAVAENQAKQLEIAATRAQRIAELVDVRKRLQQSRGGDATDTAASNRIRAILGDPPVGVEEVPDQQRENELLRELNDLNKALDISAAKTRQEREIASRLVCNEVRPEAMKRAKAFAEAYIELHAAQLFYDQLFEEVEKAGADTGSLRRVFPSYLGSPRDTCGGFHYSLREFVDAGVIARSDIPVEVR